jgi:hypothetical protein
MQSDSGKILAVSGDVTILTPGGASTQKASIGQPVPEGSQIVTASGSKVMIGLTEGASTLLEADSSLDVNNLKVAKKGDRITKRDILIDVKKGSALSFLKSTGEISDFKVQTPLGIAAARGTIWRASSESIQVLDGVVSVTLPDGTVISVPAGKQVTPDGTVDVIDDDVLAALIAKINENTNLNAELLFSSDGTAELVIKNADNEVITSPTLNPLNTSDSETNNNVFPEPAPVMKTPSSGSSMY